MSIDLPAIHHYFAGKHCENHNDQDQLDELNQPSEWLDRLEGEVPERGEELHIQEGEQMHRQEGEWSDGQDELLDIVEGEAVEGEGELVHRQEGGEVHRQEREWVDGEGERHEVKQMDKQQSKVMNQEDQQIELEIVRKKL